MAAELLHPIGQAALWYDDVIREVPPSGMRVARQIARLCADDSRVSISWRSLADAVGQLDTAGRHVAYTQSGVAVLVSCDWLRVETVGAKRGAVTTFYLLPGERKAWLGGVPEAVLDAPLEAA
jgi:hypothetical protein